MTVRLECGNLKWVVTTQKGSFPSVRMTVRLARGVHGRRGLSITSRHCELQLQLECGNPKWVVTTRMRFFALLRMTVNPIGVLRFTQDDGRVRARSPRSALAFNNFPSLRAAASAGAWQSQMGCNYPKGILPFGQDDGRVSARSPRSARANEPQVVV